MSDAGFFTQSLSDRDPELYASITNELGRQRSEIELIASENIVSAAVMEAQGSVMTNKYAEGYPGRRYYGGCQYRRRRRESGDRPCVQAVWLRLCQCSAQLGKPGQSGRV